MVEIFTVGGGDYLVNVFQAATTLGMLAAFALSLLAGKQLYARVERHVPTWTTALRCTCTTTPLAISMNRNCSSRSTTTVEVACSGSSIRVSVSTPSSSSTWRRKRPKGSAPTRPIKALSPPSRETPTATLAGAPPGHLR